MKQIVIKRKARSMRPNECPCCGFNTNLLENNEKSTKNGRIYCNGCSDTINNRNVTQRDFYTIAFKHFNEAGNTNKYIKISALIGRKHLSGIEIAHLCGGAYSGYVYVDMYYDPDDNNVYFRACCSNDDDDDYDEFFGRTEQVDFWSVEELISVLNKNNIHFFDGLTDENITSMLIIE